LGFLLTTSSTSIIKPTTTCHLSETGTFIEGLSGNSAVLLLLC
jgi:hypothetical protein